jgi:beta-phosphoglucomutase-like phosphatase (HAD superfamily)
MSATDMPVRYHLRDWTADWEEILRQSLEVPRERENDAIRDYFLSRYHTPSEARWRAERIFAALRYLEANAPSFEKSGYALASPQSGTISKYLTSALYRFFGAASDEDVTTPPSPDVFIEGAAEHERNDP